ncbi:cobalamin biosynthesis protein [Actinoalloteichus fjordicus]|uniref:Cobalamin biosynthesis protein CobD n=1 Tax=Actinoalloteichus fjordicus TaxID=1612552 RepID=A0AAC9LGA3_9PSEU|nr:cobalamin biosynthesis protein [Actinoalloteichus fjordicus]APU17067.1 cobalamin biosynthesis protein CobD [Actinoalloteichus fjordicus]
MNAGRAVGLLLGVAADAAFGDPRRGHPVAGFGRVAGALERRIYRDRRSSGVVFTGVLVGGGVAVGLAARRLGRLSPVAEAATTALATWAVLGGASLAEEGTTMARALDSGELAEARESLPRLCGRHPGSLDGPGLARASVESIAENTSDAVVAPLFWGAVAGVPGLLGYRAINTLDAMVGHRSPRYRQFGWASARLDDLANLVPSRATAMLTSLCAPVVGGSAQGAWRTWRRDATAHPSPNAGQVEAAFAGALEVRLGGRTVYHHGAEERPMLGDGRTPDAGDVTRGVELSRVIGAVAGVLSAATAVAVGQGLRRRPRRRGALRRGGTQR